MASSNGNDIELKVGMDTKSAEAQMDSFAKSTEKAFKSSDTKIQQMGVSLERINSKLRNTKAEMDKMNSTRVPTEQYNKINDIIKSTQQELKRAESEANKLWRTKAETAPYIEAKNRVTDLQTAIKNANATLKSEFGKKSALTDTFKEAQKEVDRYQQKVAQQASITGKIGETQGILSPEFYDAQQKLDDYETHLRSAEKSLQDLINTGQQFKDQSGYNKLTADVERWEKQLEMAENELKLIEANGQKWDLTKYNEATQKVEELRSGLTEAQEAKKMLEASGMHQQLLSEADPERARRLAEEFQNGAHQAQVMQRNIDDSKNSVSKFSKPLNDLKSAWSKAIQSIKQYKSNLKGFESSHNMSFKKMLTMVLKYVFGIRSIFLAYKKMRTVIKEGMKELATQFPEIASQVNSLNNAWWGFKSSIVSAFQPIFSYVVPALVTLIGYLTSAMNALANFFAMLTGQGFYYKAVKGNKNVAGAIGSTGSVAKDANKELAEYDKLLVIDQDKSGGGGGGGGGGGSDNGFNWEKEKGKTSQFIEDLKKAWREGDWEGLGRVISNKLSEMMEKIPWKKIYAKAKNWGKNLAKFLNGFINPRLFGNIGKTIAHALMVALTFLDTFGETFDWSNLGNSIATGINKFFKTFRFSKLAKTFSTWAKGILKALSTAIRNVEWSDIAKNIAEGIATIDAEGIGTELGTFVNSVTSAIVEFFGVKETWANLGSKMAEGINAFFKSYSGKQLAEALNNVKDAIFTAIKYLVAHIDWKEIGKDIADFIANIDIGTVALAIGGFALATGTAGTMFTAVSGLIKSAFATEVALAGGSVSLGTLAVSVVAAVAVGWKIGNKIYEAMSGNKVEGGITEQLKEIWNGLFSEDKIEFDMGEFIELTFGESTPWNDFFGDIGEAIYDYFHEDEGATELEKTGEEIFNGLLGGIVSKITGWDVGKTFKKFMDKVKNFFGIHSPSTKFMAIGEDLIEGLKLGIKNKIDAIKQWIQTNVIDKIMGPFDKLKEKWNNLKETFSNITATITLTLAGIWNKITDLDTIRTKYTKLKAKWKDMSSKLKGKLEGIFSKITDIDDVKARFVDLYNKWKDKSAELKAKVGGQISKITDLNTWRTTFVNLYNKWVGKSATFTAVLGGIKKIGELDTWKSKIEAIKEVWAGAKAKFSAEFEKGTATLLDTWSSKLESFKKIWSDKTAKFKLDFDVITTDLKNWINTNVFAKIKSVFSKVDVFKKLDLSGLHLGARGGILTSATPLIAGEAGAEALVPLERNLGWLDKMATMISQKLTNTSIPLVAQGNVLPANSEFMQSINTAVSNTIDNSSIVNVLNEILNRLDTIESSDKEPIMLQLDKKVVARAVWDETNKRYKQTGRNNLIVT